MRGTLSKKTSLEAEAVLVIHTWDGKCGTEDIHNEEGINENLANDSDTSRIIRQSQQEKEKKSVEVNEKTLKNGRRRQRKHG